jgi:hypothetical protein
MFQTTISCEANRRYKTWKRKHKKSMTYDAGIKKYKFFYWQVKKEYKKNEK